MSRSLSSSSRDGAPIGATSSRLVRGPGQLGRKLGLGDVFAIASGAMLSGFFLLPGIAAGMTGNSVVLAYLLSSVMIVPAMLSVAELSTAMPKSGGAYYFIDRALGPLTGTVGGVGTWLTLVLKSAFGALGIGIYVAALVPGAPVLVIAVGSTVLFALINVVGAKETSGMQRALVAIIMLVLTIFVAHGLWDLAGGRLTGHSEGQLPFLKDGVDGLLATVGMVFVSYMGLTKVASVAGEVKNPERNIPLGMILALVNATLIYALGVWVIVKALPPAELVVSAAPVTDATRRFLHVIPVGIATLTVASAALAAFASTTNAGIMSASRYLLAMARDRLIPARFASVGARKTPGLAVLVTAASIALVLLAFDVAAVAKLAGAFQLIIFMLLHVAVIVMRHSGIDAYNPSFRSPLYPWAQIFGLISPIFLIAEMGWMPTLFCLAVAVASVAWYLQYAHRRVERRGALFHVFALLGRARFGGLDEEMRELSAEMGTRPEDLYDEVIARAPVIEIGDGVDLHAAIGLAARELAFRIRPDAATLTAAFTEGIEHGLTAIVPGVALPHARLPELEHPELVLLRSREGIEAPTADDDAPPLTAILCLLSPENDPALHLRLLAQIARHVSEPGFIERWLDAECPTTLHEELLHDDRYLSLDLAPDSKAARHLAGQPISEIDLPVESLLAVVRREGVLQVPSPATLLEVGDRVTFIGTIEGIRTLRDRYLGPIA
ncbi:MAG: amino acid permease [Planctomycetota bacterium]|jgi:amino acid transporter/mannitol/fructose-specific phosphotransferase system IIA component (Ntr-type)